MVWYDVVGFPFTHLGLTLIMGGTIRGKKKVLPDHHRLVLLQICHLAGNTVCMIKEGKMKFKG